MFDILLRHRSLIGAMIFVIAAALVFDQLEFSWYYLPAALGGGLLGRVAWGIFLELLGPKY